MLHATVFESFISIGVSEGVYQIAKITNKEYRNKGMDGHNMEDFLKNTLSQSTLDAVSMDPESGGFYCSLKLEEPGKVTKNDVRKLRTWLNRAQGDIVLAYMNFLNESLSKVQPEVEFTSEAEHLKDLVNFKMKNMV